MLSLHVLVLVLLMFFLYPLERSNLFFFLISPKFVSNSSRKCNKQVQVMVFVCPYKLSFGRGLLGRLYL